MVKLIQQFIILEYHTQAETSPIDSCPAWKAWVWYPIWNLSLREAAKLLRGWSKLLRVYVYLLLGAFKKNCSHPSYCNYIVTLPHTVLFWWKMNYSSGTGKISRKKEEENKHIYLTLLSFTSIVHEIAAQRFTCLFFSSPDMGHNSSGDSLKDTRGPNPKYSNINTYFQIIFQWTLKYFCFLM